LGPRGEIVEGEPPGLGDIGRGMDFTDRRQLDQVVEGQVPGPVVTSKGLEQAKARFVELHPASPSDAAMARDLTSSTPPAASTPTSQTRLCMHSTTVSSRLALVLPPEY